MPQEMNVPPSAEDTDNSADSDCDREMMSASTTPTLLPEQGEGDASNNNNNEPPATTSSSDDHEEQASQIRLLGPTTTTTSSSSPSPEKQVDETKDLTRVTFSPDTNEFGTPDRHASITSNRDDDNNDKSNNSPRRDGDDASSSLQKPETKTQLQAQKERIVEHSTLEHPSTTSNTPERLHVRDPEGVMPSHGHSRKFSEDTMKEIVQVEEVIPGPRETEIVSPDPPSPAPIDRSEEEQEKQQENVDSSPDYLSETTSRENMVLSSIRQEQEEPLSPLEEDVDHLQLVHNDHLQLVDQSGGAEDPMMLHATLTSPPGSVAPAPPRTVAGPYNGYMQQQQQYPPLLQPMASNSFHETTNPNQHHPLHNMHPNGFPAMTPMMQIPQLPSSVMMSSSTTTKRKITLRLMEEGPHQSTDRKSFLASFRRRPKGNSFGSLGDINDASMDPRQDRGRITVSWYEGTTSLELQEHVRRSVVRKMELRGTIKLKDMRILDESVHPPEEIVLSPFIPDGSKLLLIFTTSDAGGDRTPTQGRRSYTGGAPHSPSAAPSPFPSTHDLNGLGLNANQLALLSVRLKGLQANTPIATMTPFKLESRYPASTHRKKAEKENRGSKTENAEDSAEESVESNNNQEEPRKNEDDAKSTTSTHVERASLHPEDPIEARLQQITELLLAERENREGPRQEKRQVVFVLANYFVLFLSLIAISVEIQARAPSWQKNIEQQLTNVQACAMDQDSLYDCVSNGDFAGLIASVVLWLSRSASTKRIFLFGFESSKKLWTVVYESLVTAVCWGFSYMFIRRGMNPDTQRNFLQKYWKDAVYGSLSGFNAAFMKHVLKNLIPQEAIEDAMQDRHLKILSWLPSFAH